MAVAITQRWVVTAQARQKLARIKGGMKTAMLGAVQRTRREMVTWASKEIRSEIDIKKRDLDPSLTTTRPTRAYPVSMVKLKKKSRLPVKYFGLRQRTKASRLTGRFSGAGVTFKISKKQGRKVVAPAFGAMPEVWPKLHGHAFVRLTNGRLPIAKLHGPSAWGVFKKRGKEPRWIAYGRERMEKNLGDQVRFLLLKASGAL